MGKLKILLTCIPIVLGYFLIDNFSPSAPIFTVRPHNQTVTEGQNVTIHCNASGNPSPNISWYNLKNSDAIVASGVILVITAKRSETDVKYSLNLFARTY